MIYNSYWNRNNSYWYGQHGISDWDFKDYKKYVYFRVPKRFINKNGNEGGDSRIVYGRLSKANGEIEILLESEENGELSMPLGNFTVFDNEFYTWCCDVFEGAYYIMKFDMQRKKKARYKVSDVDGIWLVLKNQKGNMVCLLCREGNYYVECMNTKESKRLFGIEDMEISMVGYNEKYIYYTVFDAESATYYCIDIDSLEIINISDKIKNIIEGKEIYMVDCSKDAVIVKNGNERELISISCINGAIETITPPKVSSEMKDKKNGSWNYLYSGDYWLGLHEISDNPERAVLKLLVIFDKNGEIWWSDIYEKSGYMPYPIIIFAFADSLCVWNQYMDGNRNFYDAATFCRLKKGDWIDFYSKIFVNKH